MIMITKFITELACALTITLPVAVACMDIQFRCCDLLACTTCTCRLALARALWYRNKTRNIMKRHHNTQQALTEYTQRTQNACQEAYQRTRAHTSVTKSHARQILHTHALHAKQTRIYSTSKQYKHVQSTQRLTFTLLYMNSVRCIQKSTPQRMSRSVTHSSGPDASSPAVGIPQVHDMKCLCHTFHLQCISAS
jgi:hypothetical protein